MTVNVKKNHIFITGGARSGKSSHGISLAQGLGRRVAYIATAEPLDDGMKERIRAHKAVRPRGWTTIEEPIDLRAALKKAERNHDCIVIDCLTLWLTNIWEGEGASSRIDEFLGALRASRATIIVVSNEIGMGVVPANAQGRGFRDLLGLLNQKTASESDQVIMMVSGIPVRIKGRARR